MDPDITKGWRTQTDHNQQQIHFDRLQRALEAGGLGLWEINVDTLMFHRTAPSTTYASPLMGADMHLTAFLAMITAEYREAVSIAINRAMKQAEPTDVTYQIKRPDDAFRWIEAHLYPVLSTTGDVLRLIAITRDITSIRQAELERESLLQKMATARQAAERSVRQRDAFITSTVHDLRTPLTYIRGRAQLLQRRLTRSSVPGDDQVWLDEGLAQIVSGIGQMTDLLVDLQDVIFLQLGRPLDLHVAQIDLVAFTQNIVAEFEVLAPDHAFEFETAQAEHMVEIDPVRIRRVLSNLLLNAVKYSNPGTSIRCSIEPVTNGITISISDEGAGIPADELGRIFERYHRGSNVAANHEGSGIGLAGARQIIRQHNGELSVTSTLGVGSTFRIRLPDTH